MISIDITQTIVTSPTMRMRVKKILKTNSSLLSSKIAEFSQGVLYTEKDKVYKW